MTQVASTGSRDTILRLVHQSQRSALQEPHVIGLDDWAWKRRLRYGTLICDLERGLPIDLLPDRTVETVSAWLEEHPMIDTISRDGSSEYASAIKKGAPQAREVSDRWHLVKNLAGCASVLLASCLAQLRRAETAAEAKSQQEEPLSHTSNPIIGGREQKDRRNRLVKPSAKLVMSRSRLCKIKG
jgi:transposase